MNYEFQIQMDIPQIINSGHAYLDELETDARVFSEQYPDDTRAAKWEAQRKIYGFDDSETWALDSTFYVWLYERLRMYVDIGGGVVDLDAQKFNWRNKEWTQLELINEILTRIRLYFSKDYDDWDDLSFARTKEIGEIWAVILPAMWW